MSIARSRLDPELREALEAIPMPNGKVFDLTDIPATRQAVRQMAGQMAAQLPSLEAVTVEEHLGTSQQGSDVPIRLFRPAKVGLLPLLLWFHGGGQVLGYAAQDDPLLKSLAERIGCAIAAIDYRLAPEAPSPAASEDGVSAFLWLHANARSLGIDADRIGISGQSGGGGIAAATALMLRDRGGPVPLFQGLLYPMIDDRNETTSSREVVDLGIWDRETNVLAWRAVLGASAGGDDVSPYSAPARADDLSGLPPAFIAVGEFDVFRDEDVAYALRLQAAGVSTELHLYPGAYHAFDLFAPASRLAASLVHSWHAYLERQFSS